MIFDLIVLFFGCRRILYSSETPRNCKAYKQKKLCFSRKLFEKQSFFKRCPCAFRNPNRNPAPAVAVWKGGARERADDVFFAVGIKDVGAKRTLLRREKR